MPAIVFCPHCQKETSYANGDEYKDHVCPWCKAKFLPGNCSHNLPPRKFNGTVVVWAKKVGS